MTPIDPAVVESLVGEMMQNHGLKFFPDFIERALYKNVIVLGLRLADALIQHTSIVFMGHRLVLDIQAV